MVYIFLAPGFEEAEALVPADLLRRAGIDIALVGTGHGPVAGGHGIAVLPDMELSQVELEDAAMLVLPGGGRGVENLGCCPQVEQLIRLAAAREIPVAAICAAPTLLARWGLLEGKQAVCFPGLEDKLTDARPADTSVVTDETITTARAAGSAFEFGLELIRRLAGAEKAEEVRHNVHYR